MTIWHQFLKQTKGRYKRNVADNQKKKIDNENFRL